MIRGKTSPLLAKNTNASAIEDCRRCSTRKRLNHPSLDADVTSDSLANQVVVNPTLAFLATEEIGANEA
jgi:hypothetical protein